MSALTQAVHTTIYYRRLAKIWRAIARRNIEALDWAVEFHNNMERQRVDAAMREEIINYHTKEED